MSDIVVIYPDRGIEEPVLWGRFAEGRLVQSGRAALAEAAPHMAGAQCWLVAPGMDVTLDRVEMPARSQNKARAMLPFLLEDDMARGLADMHLALGPANAGGRLVALVAKARMADWLAALAAHGLVPRRMVPDYLCIAATEDTRALAFGAHVVARLADGRGFAAEAGMARLLLDEAGHVAAPRPVAERALLQSFHDGLPVAEIDLLQGGYEPSHALHVHGRAARRTAIIAGMVAAGYVALMLSQGWWYGHQADILDGQTQAVLRQVFPDIGRVVNPQAQMQARLNTLKGGTSGQFLKLSRMLVDGIDDVPAATIRNLRYDDGRGELAAEMAYGDFEDMEKVKAAITAEGGHIEEGGSRSDGDGMIGDIRVRAQ